VRTKIGLTSLFSTRACHATEVQPYAETKNLFLIAPKQTWAGSEISYSTSLNQACHDLFDQRNSMFGAPLGADELDVFATFTTL